MLSSVRQGKLKNCLLFTHFMILGVLVMSKKIVILIGSKFGKLTVKEECGRSQKGEVLWLCSCDCGGEIIVKGYALVKGNYSSCTKCPSTNEYRIDGDIVYGSVVNSCDFIIDLDDLDLVMKYQWHVNNYGYVVTNLKGKNVKMHRLIMKANTGMDIDHINGITYDNRKINLRECSHQENMWNMKKPKTNKTGYKGVIKMKKYEKYIASIKIDGRSKHLGCFDSKIEAAFAYDKAALLYRGEFAKINFAEI